MSDVIVWSKPDRVPGDPTKQGCVQCDAVKRRLEAAQVPFVSHDITAPEHAKELEYFRGLGLSTAPITEYGDILAAGFLPSEVDRVIEAWRAHHPEVVTR